jgi:hypothetical protein
MVTGMRSSARGKDRQREGNTGDSSDVYKLFNITPIRFTERALSYLQKTRLPARHRA